MGQKTDHAGRLFGRSEVDFFTRHRSFFDIPPDVEGSADFEGAYAPKAAIPNWTLNVNTGSATYGGIMSAHAIVGNPATPRLYNVNDEVPGAAIFCPGSGNLIGISRAFAPTSATRWAVVAKIGQMNAIDTDDGVSFGVGTTAPGASVDTTTNCALFNLRAVTGSSNLRAAQWNAGGFTAISNFNLAQETRNIWLAFVGKTDNSIQYYYSSDGVRFQNFVSVSGLNVNGAVAFVFIGVRDNAGSAFPVIGFIEYIRTLTGDDNVWKLTGGFGL